MNSTHKILIVDDEPNILVPLQFLMEQNGYVVRTAASGEESLEIIAAFQPDLILLDIMLPQMDGFELCQIIRQHPQWRRTRIVFLSSLGRDIDIAKGLALNADAYLIKPFSNSELVAKVKHLLREAR